MTVIGRSVKQGAGTTLFRLFRVDADGSRGHRTAMHHCSAAASLWCHRLADVVVATALEVTCVVYLNYEEMGDEDLLPVFRSVVTRSLSFCRA